MMRINLLGGPKVVAAAAAPAAVASSAIIVSAVTLVALGLATAIAFFVLRSDIQDLDAKIKVQETEKLRLAGVKAQAEAYEKTLNDLQQKKDTVDALARSRVGPVELMRALGTTATRSNDLYLKSVGKSGDRLVIQGQSNTVESIADFIANLEKSGSFTDVKLRQSFQNDKGAKTSYDFNLDCVFRSSVSGPETPTAQAGGQPAAGKRTGK